MDKRRNEPTDRERRRNRLAGAALFLLLAVAGKLYYDYCLHNPIPGSPPLTITHEAHPQDSAGDTRYLRADVRDMSNREARNERDTAPEPATETAAAGTRSMTGPLELPLFDSGDILIRNAEGRYTLRYDTAYRQASWVAYVLTGEDAAPGQAKRRDRFVPDPTVVKAGYPTATTASYKGSGYDRGHLCPSADRSRSQEENDCTFYLSNIAPQTPALNRGPWKELEEQARRWAVRCDTLYIVAGGVLTSGLDTLPSGIGIPEYFYKAILAREGNDFEAIGFLLPNATHFEGEYVDYAVPIERLQAFTSLDFYTNLPDSTEQRVEREYSYRFWFGQ